MSKGLYLAKKAIFPQLEAVIDVMTNLRTTIKQISEKHEIDDCYLSEWVKSEIDAGVLEESEEDEDDEDDEEEN